MSADSDNSIETAGARHEFVRLSGGAKTWNRVRELVLAAYAYAAGVKPPLWEKFDARVLGAFLQLETYDEVCSSLRASPYKVDAAVSRICRRLLAIPPMKAGMEALRKENRRLWEDNHLLQKACETGEALRAVAKGETSGNPVLDGEAARLLPLRNEHIGSLKLSLTAEDTILRAGVRTLFDLVGLTEGDFKRLSRAKAPVMGEIRRALSSRGLSFGMHTMNLSGLGQDYLREGNPYK